MSSNRTSKVTVQFTEPELALVHGFAAAASLKVSPFLRGLALNSGGVSPDTNLVLGEVRRLGELMLRLEESSRQAEVGEKLRVGVREIAAQVLAIDARVMLAAGVKR